LRGKEQDSDAIAKAKHTRTLTALDTSLRSNRNNDSTNRLSSAIRLMYRLDSHKGRVSVKTLFVESLYAGTHPPYANRHGNSREDATSSEFNGVRMQDPGKNKNSH
jgi:hypothetical protein